MKKLKPRKTKANNWYSINFFLPSENKETSYGIYVHGNRDFAIQEVKKIYPNAKNIR